MTAMTEDDILPHVKTKLDLTARKDVFLIADVETRRGGKFNMTVHSLPRTKQTEKMVYALKTNSYAFRCGDYNDDVLGYMDVTNGNFALRGARETWHYAAWKDKKYSEPQKGWLRLETGFDNDTKMLGGLGLPVHVRHYIQSGSGDELKDAFNSANPYEKNIITSSDIHYENLTKPFAVERLTALVKSNGYVQWIDFNQKNHPDHGVSQIIYNGVSPGQRLERKQPPENRLNGSKELSSQEAAPLWEKVGHFGETTMELCKKLKIPNVAEYGNELLVMKDINEFNFDGVTGNYCPVLNPTYQRLGMHFEL